MKFKTGDYVRYMGGYSDVPLVVGGIYIVAEVVKYYGIIYLRIKYPGNYTDGYYSEYFKLETDDFCMKILLNEI